MLFWPSCPQRLFTPPSWKACQILFWKVPLCSLLQVLSGTVRPLDARSSISCPVLYDSFPVRLPITYWACFSFALLSPSAGRRWLSLQVKTCHRRDKRKLRVFYNAVAKHLCTRWRPYLCSMQNDFQCLSSCAAAWRSSSVHMMVLVHYDFCFLPAVFVMTAVPPTFFPS